LIRIASLFNPKAKAWINGRKDIFSRLEQQIKNNDKLIWMHCSSAGEFEQGKPVLEQIKTSYPGYRILVSFFSPSGYSVAKNYPFADIITYLPLDTRSNAEKFIKLVRPELVIFVKYEFWYHHLSALAFRHIPVILISAVFRKDQVFFRSYGKFYRQVLFMFRRIFVQDKKSLELLQQFQAEHCTLAGDTRFDRVSRISDDFKPIPAIEHFINGEKLLMAGSTWPEDEKFLSRSLSSSPTGKIIIAPHEIDEDHLQQVKKYFPGAVRFSMLQSCFEEETEKGIWSHINREEKAALQEKFKKEKVLIIDNVGMLSRLYKYADITYVGGGFSKDGIHNILEPAVFGKPILFGPNYKKYREASELIENKAAFSFDNDAALRDKISELLSNNEYLEITGARAKDYIESNKGATGKILDYIQENRLLTIW
jgi:3-deoxy-D-manno-octulosonic-acid transferase